MSGRQTSRWYSSIRRFCSWFPLRLFEDDGIEDIHSKKDIAQAVEELISDYEKRKHSGLSIVEVAGGYQMCSHPENEPWLKKMYRERGKQKLSTASLETLAITAYKQPITRVEVEAIRGVNVDGVIRHLSDLGLIKIGGRKEVVGRPFLYITTRKFLEYFGLITLKDLPKLEEFTSLAQREGISDAITNSQEGQVQTTT